MSLATLKYDLDDPEDALKHVRAVYADDLVWFIGDLLDHVAMTDDQTDLVNQLIEQHRIGHLF